MVEEDSLPLPVLGPGGVGTKQRSHLMQRHLRRCHPSVPLFYFPFGRCQNTTLRRSRCSPSLFHICRSGSSPTNTCFAAESNYGRQQLRLEEEEEEEEEATSF